MANYFINDMNTSALDAIDDEELAEALLLKADKLLTYTKLETNSTFATQTLLTSQLSTLETAVTSNLELKVNSNQVYNKTQIDSIMLNNMESKQDVPAEGETFALTSVMLSNMESKQDVPAEGESFALTSVMLSNMDSKADKAPDNDSYALTSVMISNLLNKQDIPADSNDSFALVSDIPALSGGYTTSQIDGFLADKVDSEDVYTKTESDSNYLGSVTIGSVSTLPAYDMNTGQPNQASVVNTGTGNEVVLDFSIPQGIPGGIGPPGQNGSDGDYKLGFRR